MKNKTFCIVLLNIVAAIFCTRILAQHENEIPVIGTDGKVVEWRPRPGVVRQHKSCGLLQRVNEDLLLHVIAKDGAETLPPPCPGEPHKPSRPLPPPPCPGPHKPSRPPHTSKIYLTTTNV
jgi:hypothetical protein